MVQPLEYLARSAVFENTIRENQSRYKQYILIDEHIDQYANVIEKKFPLLKIHKLAVDTLLVFK